MKRPAKSLARVLGLERNEEGMEGASIFSLASLYLFAASSAATCCSARLPCLQASEPCSVLKGTAGEALWPHSNSRWSNQAPLKRLTTDSCEQKRRNGRMHTLCARGTPLPS